MLGLKLVVSHKWACDYTISYNYYEEPTEILIITTQENSIINIKNSIIILHTDKSGDRARAQSSRKVRVSSAGFEHLPTRVEREKEEDDKHEPENGEHEDAHDQVHCRERSLYLVRVVRDGVGLVQ